MNATTNHSDTTTGRRRPAPVAVLFLVLALMLVSGCDGMGSASEAEYLERAEQHMQSKDYSAAIIEYRNALRLEERPGTRAALGRAYLEDEQYANAVTHLERAHNQIEDPALRLPLARAWFQLERWSEIEALPQAEGLSDRDAAELSSYRALAYLAAGEVDTARTLLDQARALVPDLALHSLVEAQLAFREGDAERAERAAREAIDADAELAPAWALLGDLARWQGDSEGALEAYGQALDLRPERIAERLKRGLLLVGLERYEDAAADARLLRRGASGHPGGHFLQGLVHFQQDEPGAAQPYFEEALSAYRNYRPAMPYLAAIHLENGDYSQAEHQLQRHAALGEGTTMTYRLWARLHMEQGDLEAARHLLERALEQHPEMTPALGDMLASLYLDAGEPDRGIEFLRTSLDRGQESPATRSLLARALVEHGDVEGARDLLREDPASERGMRAMESLRQGEYAEALDLAREMIAEAPEQAQGYTIQGAALLGLERFTEARVAFQDGLEAAPDSVSLAMNLGALEMRLGNRATARDVFENLQRQSPGHPASAMRLAAMAVAEEDLEAAREWLQAAIDNHPDQVRPRLMLARLFMDQDRPADAIATLERTLERHPEEPQVLFAMADVHERQGSPRAALPFLRRLVELRPRQPEFHFRLARVLAATGDHEASAGALRTVLELDSGHTAAQRALIRQLGLSGDLDAARTALGRLRDREGDSARVVAEEAWLLAREGRDEAAIDRYTAALEQQPARQWMVERYELQMANDRSKQALGHLEGWLEDNPQDHAARHLLGSLQIRRGRSKAAETTYRQLVERRPEDLVALNNLAWLLRREASGEALEYARRARDLAPEEPTVLDTLGVVLLNSGDPEGAQKVLQTAYAHERSTSSIGFNLARAQLAAGDRDAAAALLRELLATGGEFPERPAAEQLLKEIDE